MKTKVIYINCKWQGQKIETVDQFEYNNKQERIEAKRYLFEYRLTDPTGNYYFSSRCTNDWKRIKNINF